MLAVTAGVVTFFAVAICGGGPVAALTAALLAALATRFLVDWWTGKLRGQIRFRR